VESDVKLAGGLEIPSCSPEIVKAAWPRGQSGYSALPFGQPSPGIVEHPALNITRPSRFPFLFAPRLLMQSTGLLLPAEVAVG